MNDGNRNYLNDYLDHRFSICSSGVLSHSTREHELGTPKVFKWNINRDSMDLDFQFQISSHICFICDAYNAMSVFSFYFRTID